MMSADCLVLLSDIDGLYTAPPGSGVDAQRLDEVRQITPEIEAMAGSAGTELSRGGMVTKIEAGRIALASGTNMVITSGKVLHPLRALAEGAPCTWFLAPSDPVTARKRWIAGQLEPKGIVADRCRRGEGAAVGQEPAAGRRDSAWKARSSAATPWSSAPPTAVSSAAASSPMHAATRRVSSARRAARSPPSWAMPAAPSWSIATTWC